jgi:hypothetical protein
MNTITGLRERYRRQRILEKLYSRGKRASLVVIPNVLPAETCPFNAIGFENHAHYIGSNLWARIRKCVLQRDKWACADCESEATTVHHLSYSLPVLLGEDGTGLVSLCRTCHSRRHA